MDAVSAHKGSHLRSVSGVVVVCGGACAWCYSGV